MLSCCRKQFCEFGHTILSFITGCFEGAIWRENLKAIDTFLFFAPGFTQQVQDSGVTQQERAEKWRRKTSTLRVCPRRPTSRLVHIPFFNLAGFSELGSTSKALQRTQQSFLRNPPIPRSACFIGEFLFLNNQMEGGIIKTGACEGRSKSWG